ncbi:hypothetical protein AC1031_012468 [Aphanomyces cochlioides]|nr:hypothetical protein AC1031_012468 [Aphanomyces cochlioides]
MAISETQTHVNSDGSMDRLITNINQTLVAMNGSASIDTIGVNSVQHFVPLGEHYKVSTNSYPVVLDVTDQVNPTLLAGWNVGRASKKAITITWDYGHDVANRYELVSLQLLFLGLKGFLAQKHVMTFSLAAGFERRKLALFIWICSIHLALVYPDIVCLYPSSTGLIWFFVVLVFGALYNCIIFLFFVLASCIPSPFTHVITILSLALNNSIFVFLEVVHMWQLPAMLDHYRNAPIKLGLNISGVIRPSGAYHNDKMTSVLTLVQFDNVWLLHFVHLFFNMDFETQPWNQCGMPNWITGLPLVEETMTKIDNSLYCQVLKPPLVMRQLFLNTLSVIPVITCEAAIK